MNPPTEVDHTLPDSVTMKALITGAGGFVGAHLTNHLTDCGDEVIGTDRSIDGCDILEPDQVLELLRRVRPDVIYHLAGASDVGGSWSNPLHTFRVNAEGTLNVLWAAREVGVERVLAVGSADVYGKVSSADLPITEDQPLAPVSPYAASKVSAEVLAEQAFRGHSQDVISVRPFNHLGPGQTTQFVAPALAHRIVSCEQTGDTVVPVGNLTPQRDFTDVRDVVRAYRLLIEHGTSGEVYNICSGKATAISELASLMLELSPLDLTLEPQEDLIRPVDIPVLLGSNEKLCKATGWAPTIDLRTTLRDLLAAFRSDVVAAEQGS